MVRNNSKKTMARLEDDIKMGLKGRGTWGVGSFT
jgi:hypothetical protein